MASPDFPENPDLALTLPIDRSEAGTSVTLQTSDGQTREYRRVGVVEVPIGEESAKLTLLALPGHSRLFLPFDGWHLRRRELQGWAVS